MEENIYTWQPDADSQQQWGYTSQNTVPSLKQFADSFNNRQITIRKAKSNQSYNDDVNLMNNLYEAQTSAKDKNVASESGKAIRKTQIAFWIRDFYNNNYKDELNQLWINLDSMTNWEVMDWYTELNPNSYDLLKDYIITERDINDPLELYYKMWIMPSDDSISLSNRIKTSVEQIRNWDMEWYFNQSRENIKKFWSDFAEAEMSWPTEMYYWLRNFVNWVQWLWDNDANWFWALQNYAHEEMWKDVSQLSTLELYWISEKLKNPEVFADYAPTPVKWWIETVAWFTDTLFTIAARPVKLLFSAADADPLTRPLMNVLWWTQEKLMWEWFWWILTFPLEWYVNSLPENDRKKWYAWLGSVLTLWLAFKSKNSWPRANDLFRWILKDLWRDKLVWWFEDKVLKPLSPMEYIDYQLNWWPKWQMWWEWLEWWTWLTPVEEWAIAEQMWLEAGRTINPKYIYENKQASDAYSQLDPEQLRNVKDFKSLIQMLKNSIKWKASTQDAILDTIDKRYWMWTEYREPIEWRWEFSDIPSRTVEKWFNIMERYTTFTRDKNILNIMSKVANKNKLTAKDMKNMARALDRQFKIWKKWKTHEEIKQWEAEIEATRQELNALIRQEVDLIQDFREIWIPNILEYLDKQQSPQIATIEKLVELNNKVNQIKAAIPNKSTLNKIWTFLWRFSSKAKAANTIIEKMWWADYMDALVREKNLNRALNAFSDLYEKIRKNPDNADKVINEWLKDKNNKEVAENYWWFVEWEVIEPDFNPSRSPNEFLEELLETVEIEKPENFMLWEDTSYNWQWWIDYTTPTRVTPEWYPWRYWATSESYKWKPAWDFWTPAEFEPKTESKPITAEDYAGKYGQTLESFKAQLQKAWLKTDLIDAFIGNLEKRNFKVWWKQWTLFDIPSETKTTTKDKTPLKKAKKSSSKKTSQEDTKWKKSDSNPK